MATEESETFIEWDEKRYATEIERFDDQHKHLFGLLNELYIVMNEGRSDEKVGEILEELEAYTEYHFGDEEEFMQDCGFAWDCSECFFNHREMHDQFAEKISELRQKHENGEYISMEMLMFARNWLDSHIAGLNQDQNYGEYYSEEVPDDYEYEPGTLRKDRKTETDPHVAGTKSQNATRFNDDADSQNVTESRTASATVASESVAAEQNRQTVADDRVQPQEQTVTLGTDITSGPSLSVPDESLGVWMEQLAQRHGKLPAVRIEEDGTFTPWSFEGVLDDARLVAAGFLQMGFEPGDRVGLHLSPRYEWSLLDGACYLAGVVSVPVPPLYRPERAAHVVADAGVDILITDTHVPPQLRDHVNTILQVESLPRGDISKLPGGDPSNLPGLDADPDDVASIVYRLGTTDHPNGCALTHRNIRAATEMLCSELPLKPEQTGTCLLPLAHMYQRIAAYALWDAGSAIAYMNPNELVPHLRAVEPEILVAVPAVYRQLYDELSSRLAETGGLRGALSSGVSQSYGTAKDKGNSVSFGLSLKHRFAERTVFPSIRNELGLGNLEHALTGTDSIDPEILRFFRGLGIPVSELYGTTELSGVASINRAGTHLAGTVGTPLPGTELALASDDEILVRGPNVIEGYWNDPTVWRQRLCEGWYHTGDLGTFDEDGALVIRGPK